MSHAAYPAAWPPPNFLGLPPEHSGFETSRALLLPVPYEATTSYRGGTREGPRAIIEASAQVELYDAEFGCEPAVQWGLHTLPALRPDLRSADAALAGIADAVAALAGTGKLLGMLGGEHSLSIGVARGLRRALGPFVTVQLDAHADLRDTYEGTPYSHACAMRRILEESGGDASLVQLGIRSLDAAEAEFLRRHPDDILSITAEEMHRGQDYRARLIERIQGRNVFLTLDVDAFDPSVMPSTGTPEPGGLSWYTVLDIVRTVATCSRIIAFDCVELSPIPGLHFPDFTAAKLVYKVFSLALNSTARLGTEAADQ